VNTVKLILNVDTIAQSRTGMALRALKQADNIHLRPHGCPAVRPRPLMWPLYSAHSRTWASAMPLMEEKTIYSSNKQPK